MKLIHLALILVLAAPGTALAGKKARTVVIDAAEGNSHVHVQAALDANPEDTTFLLKGDFVFGGHVHIEKSGTRILGDYEDLNGNGRADEGDAWHTTLTGVLAPYGGIEAFVLQPRDEVNAVGYDVRDLEVSGIRFRNFNVPVAVFSFPFLDQVGCRSEPLPYELRDVLLEHNWVEGGGFWIYRQVSRLTIRQNLFTLFEGEELFAHAIEMRGLMGPECGQAEAVFEAPGQEQIEIIDNEFRDGRDISVGTQRKLRVTGNVMTGVPPLGYPSYKLWISQASDAVIKGNHFEGNPINGGIFLLTRTNFPVAPDLNSDKVRIIENEFVDNNVGITVYGGTRNTTIAGNDFYHTGTTGETGSFGILLTDLADVALAGLIVSNPSQNVMIRDNVVSDAGDAGILLNGETTGITISKNDFDNPDAQFGDVFLAPEDILFNWGDALCPAQGNRVKANKKRPAIVLDGYAPVCDGSAPNELKGKGLFILEP